MKKIHIFLASCLILGGIMCAKPVGTNETDASNWGETSYVSFPVFKIFDSVDAFMVVYQKESGKIGSTVIPKSWSTNKAGEQCKLIMRNITGLEGVKPYMSVVKKGGEFHHVILNVPLKGNIVWGIVEYGHTLKAVDKTTLEALQP